MVVKSSLYSFIVIAALIVSLLSVYACSKKTPSPMMETNPSLSKTITNMMGKKVTTIDNEAGDHVLCIKKEGSLLSSFMVLSKQGEVMIEKKKVRGTVAWHDNSSVEVTIVPGVVDKRSEQPQAQKTIITFKKDKEAI